MYKFRLIILILMFAVGNSMVKSVNLSNESLNYHIIYHWGLIWKHAATATLEIHDDGENYNARLYAHTLSWVDKIYRVRDTLYSTIDSRNLVPIKYVKATHEKNYVCRDVVNFRMENNKTIGDCLRKRPGRVDFEKTLVTNGEAFDMLSVFYKLRTLDMVQLKKKGYYTTTVFSGTSKERLDIWYVGDEKVEMRDESTRDAIHLKFTFTEDGKEKSSDDIDAWISNDADRIPLLLRGKLPIGEVRVYCVK